MHPKVGSPLVPDLQLQVRQSQRLPFWQFSTSSTPNRSAVLWFLSLPGCHSLVVSEEAPFFDMQNRSAIHARQSQRVGRGLGPPRLLPGLQLLEGQKKWARQPGRKEIRQKTLGGSVPQTSEFHPLKASHLWLGI